MRLRHLLLSTILATLAASSLAGAEEKPVLTIYTYNSFTSEWGPGGDTGRQFGGEENRLHGDGHAGRFRQHQPGAGT